MKQKHETGSILIAVIMIMIVILVSSYGMINQLLPIKKQLDYRIKYANY